MGQLLSQIILPLLTRREGVPLEAGVEGEVPPQGLLFLYGK